MLRDVDLSAGWIINQRGALRAAKDASDEERAKGNWLPDEATALAYTALNRYGHEFEIVATPASVVAAGEKSQLRLKKIAGREWKTVDLWIDGQKSKGVTSEDAKLELPPMKPGVHSAVAIGRREDGKTLFSAPYVWVVKDAPDS